jgi:FkbM family methyltransferase
MYMQLTSQQQQPINASSYKEQPRLWRFSRLIRRTSIAGLLVFKVLPKPVISFIESCGIKIRNRVIPLYLNGYQHPVWVRYASSDRWAIRKIFIEDEYQPLDNIAVPEVIIDCGANAGYSAFYFLSKYPLARLIAIEPDSENMKICKKTLSPFSDRVSYVQSGLWSHETGLKLVSQGFGKEWGIQVVECSEDESPDLVATDILSVMEKFQITHIDLLKVDIEGSEKVVFSANSDKWLDKVKNVAIELHDETDHSVFKAAIKNYHCDISISGELTICTNLSR